MAASPQISLIFGKLKEQNKTFWVEERRVGKRGERVKGNPVPSGLSQGVDDGARHRGGDPGSSLDRRCVEFRLGHDEVEVPMRQTSDGRFLLVERLGLDGLGKRQHTRVEGRSGTLG